LRFAITSEGQQEPTKPIFRPTDALFQRVDPTFVACVAARSEQNQRSAALVLWMVIKQLSERLQTFGKMREKGDFNKKSKFLNVRQRKSLR
jgi:hypothetical protein